jgi:four helix bundle protein
MTIRRFEDIRAWQEARILVQMIYVLTGEEPLSKDFGLRDQLQRAAVSAMTNIAEGFDCESHAEFSRFLGYSRRSAVEVQSLLYVAFDVGYMEEAIFQEHYNQANKVKAMVSAFKKSLRKS